MSPSFKHPALLALAALLLAACAGEGDLHQAPPPVRAAPASPAAPAEPPPAAEAQPSAPDDSLYFESGETTLGAANQELLRRHAERIKALGTRRFAPRIVVVGHTDNVGSRSLNLAIAGRRIDAVIAGLRSYGVPASRLKRNNTTTDKVDPACLSEACRRLMRRVDLIYPATD